MSIREQVGSLLEKDLSKDEIVDTLREKHGYHPRSITKQYYRLCKRPKLQGGSGGLSLNNANVYQTKPQDALKGLIYSLPKERAFPLEEMAEQWHVSVERLDKRARQYRCRRFVEVPSSLGDFIKCVLHPETAEKYKG